MNKLFNSVLMQLAIPAIITFATSCAVKTAQKDSISHISNDLRPRNASLLQGNQQVRDLSFTGILLDNGDLQIEFRRAARGWTAAHFSANLQSFSLMHDGKELADAKQLVHNDTEFILELPAGNFTMTASAANASKPICLEWLHAIPEIYFWAPAPGFTKPLEGRDSFKELGPQLFDSLTSFFPGALLENEIAQCREKGRSIYGNILGHPLWSNNQTDFFKDIENEKYLTSGAYDGLTIDEFVFVDDAHCNGISEALPKIVNPRNIPVYTWLCGGLFTPEGKCGIAQRKLLDTIINKTPGERGAALLEIYLCGAHNANDMAVITQQQLLENVQSLKAAYPLITPRLGVVLGCYNSVPILTLENDPNIDYKYFLDYQMNILANHPEFTGMPIVGTWGGNYAQIDFQRWTLALLRHYFIQGNRGMLSDKFGFTPELHFSENGDFRHGLQDWHTTGDVKAVPSDGWFQGRWGGGSETAASLTRTADAPAELHQTLKGLTPGRTYMLQYVTVDGKELREKTVAPRKLALEAELSNVKIISDQLYIDDWRPEQSARYRTPFARSNLRRILFVPDKTESKLILSNKTAEPGDELLVNFVQVKPFFTTEMLNTLP